MPEYMLSMHYGDWTPPAEELEVIMKDVAAFNEELQAAGGWGFTSGLEPPSTATVVRVEGGQVLTTDGPYLETKEHLGGFWVIKADDLDDALAWAAKAATALRGLPLEVRPVSPGSCF